MATTKKKFASQADEVLLERLREVARHKTRQILKQHFPRHLSDEIDKKLRTDFEIHLPEAEMKAKEPLINS